MTRTISERAASTTNAGKTRPHLGALMRRRRALLLAQSACAGVVAGFICFAPGEAAALIDTCPGNPIDRAGVTVANKTCTFAGMLYVGQTQDGDLTISGGGKVESQSGSVGADANGHVTVTGAGSSWIQTGDIFSSTGRLYVGQNSSGTVTVSDGGYVSNLQAYLGTEKDGFGTVIVTGNGSHWENGGAVSIGLIGSGTLEIEDEGKVSGKDMSVGAGNIEFGGAGGTVTVTGANSLLDLTGLSRLVATLMRR